MLTIEKARALPEDAHGIAVYFLWWKGELQYIGGTKDAQERMRIHWYAMRAPVWIESYNCRIRYDRATFLYCDDKDEMRKLERHYIREFSPPCNIQGRVKKPRKCSSVTQTSNA